MCGVIGVYSTKGVVIQDLINGLFQMQHRGQDACGIAISDKKKIRLRRGLGYVKKVFNVVPSEFTGTIGCGHVRYPTQGSNRLENTQPQIVTTLAGTILALSSNGDVTNYHAKRVWLEERGVSFNGTNDAELLLKFISYHHLTLQKPLIASIRAMQSEIRGAYSSCLITKDRLFAFRDPLSMRPLSVGKSEDYWVVASETTALDICRVDLFCELDSGEIIEIHEDLENGIVRYPHPDVNSIRERTKDAHCSFEYIYFSRPDSIAFGQRVYDVRKRIGAWLFQDDRIKGDVIVPVPDSANSIALGYAQASGIPLEFGLIRNHYVGRTFIGGDQTQRVDNVKQKFNPLRSVFKDKRVILVDDSIVRGTTLRKIVRMVRGAGAKEVHLRIGSPITKHSCFYGVDTPNAEELIGNKLSTEEICAHLTADSLRYMTVQGLKKCIGDQGNFCLACFDGNYPSALTEVKIREK